LSKISKFIRTLFLIIIVFLMLFLCVIRLMKLQIVDGAKYLALAETSYTSKYEIIATRGQIFDQNGVLLTTNRTVYKVILQKSFLENGTENEILNKASEILKNNGEEWNDSVPVSYSKPYVFTDVSSDEIYAFKERIRVNADATADNCIRALIRKYNIDTVKYTEEEQRIIAGLRYEMELKDFSYDNRFTLAEDISLDTVIKLKEIAFSLKGIDIIEEGMREYIEPDTAPHILGTVGALSYDEYQTLKDEGYSFNDSIGNYGIERAMESVLRGKNGERTIARDSNGNAVSDEITRDTEAGNSVMLTINYDFQNDLQEILKNQINWLNNSADRGNDCDAGAVVVLNAKTGAVLGTATYPTYNLNDSIENYSAVLNAEGNPMYNRCTNGLYRPGSAFKTITAADGLINGLIDKNSRAECTGIYTYYSASDYQPKCTGFHLGYDVVNCLKWSCNIFFYDLGRRLGIDELYNFASTHN